MVQYYFVHLVKVFVLDSKGTILDTFSSLEKAKKKYAKMKAAPTDLLTKALTRISEKHVTDLRQKNLQQTIEDVKASVQPDIIIIRVSNTVQESERISNQLGKRLRDWAFLSYPEMVKAVYDDKKLAHLLTENERATLLKQAKLTESTTMGAPFSKEGEAALKKICLELLELHDLKEELLVYMESVLKEHMPNLLTLVGAAITGKLLVHAGSLKSLMEMPASTIQLLGAEKALFRHMKTKARSPKHGLIIQHPIVGDAPRDKRGKAARALADKIAIAARIDFFKGEFMGDELLQQLEKRFMQ